MKLPIRLFSHLEKLIELLGGPAPEVVLKDLTPGKTKFIILLDVTNIRHPTVSGLPRITIYSLVMMLTIHHLLNTKQ
jgi:hypothetical protein